MSVLSGIEIDNIWLNWRGVSSKFYEYILFIYVFISILHCSSVHNHDMWAIRPTKILTPRSTNLYRQFPGYWVPEVYLPMDSLNNMPAILIYGIMNAISKCDVTLLWHQKVYQVFAEEHKYMMCVWPTLESRLAWTCDAKESRLCSNSQSNNIDHIPRA
jgi:hypothetical protein